MERNPMLAPDPRRFAISAGSLIMVVPSLYWLGIAFAALFEKAAFVKTFILTGSPATELINILVFIVMPLLVLLINIKSRLMESETGKQFDARMNQIQWALILLAISSIIGAFSYTFFDRMDLLYYIYIKP